MGASPISTVVPVNVFPGADATPLRLRWPSAAVLEGLQEVDLLEVWLQRQLERNLLQLWCQRHGPDAEASLPALIQHWFSEPASSLFLQRRQGLDQVLISVLQLDDAQLAQEFWFRLQAGEMDFHHLSHHSLGPERELGGRLGPMALQDLDPLLHPLLQRLSPGELAAPLMNADGSVLLLRMEQRWPARLDAPTRQALADELYARWRDAQLQPLLRHHPAPGSVVSLLEPWV